MTKKSKPAPKKSLFARNRLLIVIGGALAAIVAAFYAFTGDDAPKRHVRQEPVVTTEKQVSVEVFDRDYDSRDLTITPGTRVTWNFTGDLPHNVVDDRGAFESPTLKKGDEWSLTFDDPGTFYYCTLHHAMQGILIVAE